MEPRARAGKNVGKETFPPKEIAAILYSHGDAQEPLPESVRVVDEILRDFVEGICFEAHSHANYAGRQKLKLDDFEFAMRHHPDYLGKVRDMMDKRKEIAKARKTFDQTDDAIVRQGSSLKRFVKREDSLDGIIKQESPLDDDTIQYLDSDYSAGDDYDMDETISELGDHKDKKRKIRS